MRYFKIVVGIILFAACNNTINVNQKLVVGNWKVISWVNSKNMPVEKTTGISFAFNSDGKYIYSNDGVNEKGSYKVENDMLFTKPENENEIMVKIMKATSDSLVLMMNRAGQEELLSLIKK